MLGGALCLRSSSTICSRAERSTSRVRAACFSLLSLLRSFSTVASRLWILAFATWRMKGEMRMFLPLITQTGGREAGRGGCCECLHSAFGDFGAETSLLAISSGHRRTTPASGAGQLDPYKHPDILLNLLPWCSSSGNEGLRRQHQNIEGPGPPIYPGKRVELKCISDALMGQTGST